MQPTFAELGVPARLVDALAASGKTEAFPVQAATLPDALAGHDLCGRAPTGSGKTLAFGIPALARVANADPGRPTGLILSPTRELADQIRQELLPLAKPVQRFVHAVYGGVGYGAQITALRRGVDILVACPGRLIDLIDGGHVSLADVGFVVVDEADRMADMGFLPVVKRLLDQTSPNRQTLLFSATLDGDIVELTRRYQHNPKRHEVGEVEPDLDSMAHHFWSIRHEDRVEHTRNAVTAAGPTIVFTRTRHGADRLCRQLEKAGVPSAAIHGGRNQNQRTRALESFTRGNVRALIATDVAARGIHVDGVACVVHFDPPEDDKTYLHRSGRTARAGAKGVVVSLVRPDNRKAVKTLQRDLGLEISVAETDAGQLGDGTGHRPISSASASNRTAPQRSGNGDRRQRSRNNGNNANSNRNGGNNNRNGGGGQRSRGPRRDAEGSGDTGSRDGRGSNAGRSSNARSGDGRNSRPNRTPRDGQPSGDRRPAGERRPNGDRRPSGDRRPERSRDGCSGAKRTPTQDRDRTPPNPSKVHRKGGGAKRKAREAAGVTGPETTTDRAED